MGGLYVGGLLWGWGGGGGGGQKVCWPLAPLSNNWGGGAAPCPPSLSLSLSLSLPTALLILSFHAYFAVESITPKF